MKKDFDCVEMKRRGAEQVMERIRNMTREEELAYWAAQGQKLEEHQRKLKSGQKRSA